MGMTVICPRSRWTTYMAAAPRRGWRTPRSSRRMTKISRTQRPRRTLTSWGGPRLHRPETLPPLRGTAEAGTSDDVKFRAYQEAIVKTNRKVMQNEDIAMSKLSLQSRLIL